MNYTNKGNKATKTGFGEGVLAAAQQDKRVVGLGADITNSVGMNLFAEAYPDRCVTTMCMSSLAVLMPAYRSAPMVPPTKLWRTSPPCVCCPT